MNRKYVLFLLLSSIAFTNTELENSKSYEIINSILAEYNKNISFTLDANHPKMEFSMNIKMMYYIDVENILSEFLSSFLFIYFYN